MPEMTENQTLLRRTHRKKNRETHNAVERHRKKKINSGINKIGELIPCSPALKQSKNMILDQAYKYISELKRQNDEILLNGGTKEQGEEIVRLRKQLDDLQKENDRFMELLKANDICLHDDPTIHWKRKFKGTKVTMMISPSQVQEDILIYTNGNQLNGNCHQATVQSSPELTLNTLKNTTQETSLDIMMPMAMPDIGPVANGVQLQTRISQQEIPECLPTARTSLNTAPCTTAMSTVQSMLNVSSNSTGPVLLQCPASTCALTPLACPVSTSAQVVLQCSQARYGRSTSEAASGCPIPNVSANTCLALPLQQMGTMCVGVECPGGTTQQTVLGSTSASVQSSEMRSTKWPISECPQNVTVPNICQNSPALVRGLPLPFKVGATCHSGVMSSCPAASSWTVSCPASTNTCASNSNSLGAFTCMTFAGNTRTTWTTLQLAGNTVHPVSQVSCSILPTTSSENVNARNTYPASAGQVGAGSSALHGVSFCSRQLSQQLPVSLQAPAQPVLGQPHVPAPTTAKVVSLLPPLQVIQMAHPPGAPDPTSPNSQKLIILQPANASSPALVRGAINSQAPGQQIVIIQAASQSTVSVVPRPAPTLDSSQGGGSSGPSTPAGQTVGGKHLVHILPRPVPASAPSGSPASAAAAQQQQTISVNGQLFALQPVKQAGGSGHTMHVIQPTTSADPHTNVALNTFGALTSLSQSVSQMAAPRAVPTARSASPSGACVPVPAVSSPHTSGQPTPAHTSHPSALRPAHGAPHPSKPRKAQKKPLSGKQGLPRRVPAPGHRLRDPSSAAPHQPAPPEQAWPAGGSAAPHPHPPAGANPAAAASPEPTPVSEAAPPAAEGPGETPAPPAAPSPPAHRPRDDAPSPAHCRAAPPQGPGEAGGWQLESLAAAAQHQGRGGTEAAGGCPSPGGHQPPPPPEPDGQSGPGSGRGFSVASLLPDSAREDGAFAAYGLPDHSDIVALAARAIFEQESPGKGAAPGADKGRDGGPGLQPELGVGAERSVREAAAAAPPAQAPATVTAQTPAPAAPGARPPAPPPRPAVPSQGHSCPGLAGDVAGVPAAYPEQRENPLDPKPGAEPRKDAAKRTGPADHLLSGAKRHKQCPGGGAARPDGKAGAPAERPFPPQLPASSSGDALGALFPSAGLLGPGPAPEAPCGGPPAGQVPPQAPPLHGHSFYKQPRDRHPYPQQQPHLPHAEGPAHGAQLQKKRGLVRTGQALALPQKQPGAGGPSRHKGAQPQPQAPLLQHCFGGAHPDKRCENAPGGRGAHPQSLHGPELLRQHQEGGRSGPSADQVPGHHPRAQRLLTPRSLEHQLAAKGSPAPRPAELQCPPQPQPQRPERNRISSYSAEALIGKPSSAESRLALAMQSPRAGAEQPELRTYLDLSVSKSLAVAGLQPKLALDHCMAPDVQALSDCPPFKAAGVPGQAVGTFEAQPPRGGDMGGGVAGHRGLPAAHGFRLAQGAAGAERQGRLPYLPMQGIPAAAAGAAPLRDADGSCHQGFMQSLLPPALAEQLGGGQRAAPEHARSTQCAPAGPGLEYPCAPGREAAPSREGCELSLGALGGRSLPYPNPSSVPDIQGRNSSPGAAPAKAALAPANKCHASPQLPSGLPAGVRAALAHGAERPHPLQPPRARHPASAAKLRQGERPRSGGPRGAEVLERGLQLPLPSGGGMMLSRQQPGAGRAASIVRFVADGQQGPGENLAAEQHSLSQGFGFPFIGEGGMNPPLSANPPFIPPVTQPGANRTPALLPVEPQNPLPSFYPSYSPAHPTLSNDLSLPFFSNQIFTSPSTEKASNPFGSILSPPRPVGFPQPSFPLLPDIPARPMANSSSITPHLSNFNLTTLFPEIAAAPLAADTPAMPMSPLLPLTNPALSDVSKQHSNRSAHNISHILGHDGSSAV
ncbi:basic helix-loop-helix domain-containing protein USF3 [Pristis pectinata]|uniref:basic helix-loop-helix domain-containing protein USF3 n=1 Tax=Pristis pectinata TaxID=685728 RepID=UPI00223E4ACF|nr:basic helix-loop-helix domain-containing protein USF3 [Pristis pectinata]